MEFFVATIPDLSSELMIILLTVEFMLKALSQLGNYLRNIEVLTQ